jgi:hypothetical protein
MAGLSFEDFVRTALGKAIPTLPIPTDPVNIGDILNGFGGSNSSGSNFGEGLSGVLGEFFQSDGATKIFSDLGNKVLAFVFQRFSDFFKNLLSDQSGDSNDSSSNRGPIASLLTSISNPGNYSDAFGMPLKCGPQFALNLLFDCGKFFWDVDVCGSVGISFGARIATRIDVVFHAIEELVVALEGDTNAKIDDYLLGELLQYIRQRISELWLAAYAQGSAKGDLISDLMTGMFADFLFSHKLILQLFEKLIEGKLWAWLQLPCAMQAGTLSYWINNPDSYKGSLDAQLERQFRIRLAAEVGAFLQTEIDALLTARFTASVESQSGVQVATNFATLILDQVFRFIFDPECFPLIDSQWDNFEDVGFGFAGMLAVQARAWIRGSIRLILQGIWEFSVHNTGLIEFVGAVFGTIFGSIIAGFIRNLAMRFELVSTYPNANLGDAFVVYSWQSVEVITGTTERLEFKVLIRGFRKADKVSSSLQAFFKGLTADDWNQNYGTVKRFFEDLGAYLDISYNAYHIRSNFPDIGSSDKVTITQADLVNGQLILRATTDATYDYPQPILRAYVCCGVYVMKPGVTQADTYTLDVKLDSLISCENVMVLSSQGGTAQRKVYQP